MLARKTQEPVKDSSIRLLMVEDDELDHIYFREMLSQINDTTYSMKRVSRLCECFSQIQREMPDIILLDLGLEDSVGLSTLSQLLQADFDIPIVVLTGTDDEHIGEAAIQMGAEDYLPKNKTTGSQLYRSISYSIERYRIYKSLKEKACTDSLTHLVNRLGLFERLEFLIDQAERNQTQIGIAMIDLDGFKAVNDKFGHVVGDDLLKKVAERLGAGLRKSDCLARYGGDEFVFIINHYESTENFENLVRKKLHNLHAPFQIVVEGKPQTLFVGASYGISEWRKGCSSENLILEADKSMYLQKIKRQKCVKRTPHLRLV
ncbi:MAG: GGDEF domain-containing response regulator [Pseudomonadota bacterium]